VSGSVVLLRRVEVDSPVHRLWAGTKILAVAALSLTLSWVASWAAVAVVAAVLVGATLAARVPWGAVPRPPTWFWIALGVGGVLTLASGGRPEVAVGSAHVGFGGLISYVEFVLISFELLGAAAVVGWTTNLGDVAPAVATILRPLRWVRLPIDEWAAAVALSVRALPLVVSEMQILWAVRRLRPRPTGARRVDAYVRDGVELIVAALTVSLRRSAEMGEAITARGGPVGVSARVAGPGRADVVAGAAVLMLCAAAWALPR